LDAETSTRRQVRPDGEILSSVRTFVTGHTGGEPIGDDVDIFGTGHVSSLFAVQIVMWVERTFDLPVTGDDLDIRNFHSIERITRFVTDRLALGTP
jgi:methoxymalonate biosynthesis acyl carrier protein